MSKSPTVSIALLAFQHVIDLDHRGVTHGVIPVDDLAQWHGIDDWLVERPYIIGAGQSFTRRMIPRLAAARAPMAPSDSN